MPRRGGPSTVWGTLHQILGTLTEPCFLRRIGTSRDRNLEGAILIVEPEDGGDAQIYTPTATRVIQWKFRAGRRPWSLGEIISEVLPDLYRATDVASVNRRYVFVTDGRRGAWPKAELRETLGTDTQTVNAFDAFRKKRNVAGTTKPDSSQTLTRGRCARWRSASKRM